MRLTKEIPNFITLLNLFCGCVAVLYAVQGQLVYAGLFVMAGIFFDFFDGFAARILNAQSDLGLQLDSLADMVTSGVVPGIVMFQLIKQSVLLRSGSFAEADAETFLDLFTGASGVGLFGLCITLASAYRLAKFNIDTRQSTSFIGLPTPANTLLIISLPLIAETEISTWVLEFIQNTYFLAGLTIVSSILLNAEIPLFSLKFKDYSFANNKIRYAFIITCIILMLSLKFLAIPIIILAYVLCSIVFKKQLSF